VRARVNHAQQRGVEASVNPAVRCPIRRRPRRNPNPHEEIAMSRRLSTTAILAVAFVAGAAVAPAFAGNVGWSVAIGGPGFAVAAGAPGYGHAYRGAGHVAAAPYYSSYYSPYYPAVVPPLAYAPPVVYSAPVAYPAAVVYNAPYYGPRRVVVAPATWGPRRIAGPYRHY
jgi:hypothetical protein